MTPRNLFNIIIKVIGIFFIKGIFISFTEMVSFIPYLTMSNHKTDSLFTYLSYLLLIVIYGLISFFLIFRTESIIDKLKLDKGFDQETILINLHRSTILSISLIVLGGILLADEIPHLCQQIIAFIQQKRYSNGMLDPSIAYVVLASVKIIIALILITCQRQIVNFIEFRRKK